MRVRIRTRPLVVATLGVVAALPVFAAGRPRGAAAVRGRGTDLGRHGRRPHDTTDALSAWFLEASGYLQGVIRVQAGLGPGPPGSGSAGLALLLL